MTPVLLDLMVLDDLYFLNYVFMYNVFYAFCLLWYARRITDWVFLTVLPDWNSHSVPLIVLLNQLARFV